MCDRYRIKYRRFFDLFHTFEAISIADGNARKPSHCYVTFRVYQIAYLSCHSCRGISSPSPMGLAWFMSVNKVMGVMRTQCVLVRCACAGRGGCERARWRPAQYRRGTDAGRALRHINTLRKAQTWQSPARA